MEISLRRRDAEVLGARIPLPVNGEIGRAVWTLVRVQGFDEHLSPQLTGAGGQIRWGLGEGASQITSSFHLFLPRLILCGLMLTLSLWHRLWQGSFYSHDRTGNRGQGQLSESVATQLGTWNWSWSVLLAKCSKCELRLAMILFWGYSLLDQKIHKSGQPKEVGQRMHAPLLNQEGKTDKKQDQIWELWYLNFWP